MARTVHDGYDHIGYGFALMNNVQVYLYLSLGFLVDSWEILQDLMMNLVFVFIDSCSCYRNCTINQ